jgi:hypothetical protein
VCGTAAAGVIMSIIVSRTHCCVVLEARMFSHVCYLELCIVLDLTPFIFCLRKIVTKILLLCLDIIGMRSHSFAVM